MTLSEHLALGGELRDMQRKLDACLHRLGETQLAKEIDAALKVKRVLHRLQVVMEDALYRDVASEGLSQEDFEARRRCYLSD